MSLINQALKLEQQKRHAANGPIAPMVSRMSHRRQNDKLPLLLFGFTGMGMLLAASVTAIFYFGSEFLGSEKTLASESTSPPVEAISARELPSRLQEEQTAPKIEDLLGSLSEDQLSTVQKMLLNREAASTPKAERPPIEKESALLPSSKASSLSEISQIQDIVDSYSVQGIRKSGQDTRVFLSGKIRKIGDIVDIENGIQLIGFTETALVFRNAKGERFKKAL